MDIMHSAYNVIQVTLSLVMVVNLHLYVACTMYVP